ncbi:MAG: histidine kinase [Cyclobacteriaceae bacterium]|nr:histidine kinase [Cyclobacteriaceae bacterium]
MSRFFSYRLDHIIFWILTVLFHGYTRLPWINKAGLNQFIIELVVRNGLLACAIYITIGLSLPRLTQGKERLIGLLWLLLALLIYVVGKNAHDVYFYGYIIGDASRVSFFHSTYYNLSIVLFYLSFACTLYLSKQWYLQREKMRLIEMEKLSTELEYLRAQVNPHFLFNSINTIYFQIDKQNTTARETLEKFSEMLRYQLYECTNETIAIEKEVLYLHNYIALQKLRLSDRYVVELATDVALKGLFIPPLMLIPFIENMFKHVSHFTDKPNTISIALKKEENGLLLITENTTDSSIKNESGGIGLKNVIRRLDLLYGEHYKLEIKSEDERFRVTLQIPFL